MNSWSGNLRYWLSIALIALATTFVVPASAQSTTWPWAQLTDLQKKVLAPFKDQWNNWSTQDKRAWVLLANRFPRLNADERQRAQARIAKWATLTPSQRQTARESIRLSREAQPGERRAEWERYQQMTKEQKAVLRDSGRLSATGNNRNVRSGLASDAAQPLGRNR